MIKSHSAQSSLKPILSRSAANWKKAIQLCTFCLLLITTMGCNSSRDAFVTDENNQEWKVVKVDKGDKPAWAIYSRKLSGTNLHEFKIEGEIHASPQACIAAFRQDIQNQAADTNNKKYPTYEILDKSADNLLTYVIHNEPFPFKDTEMRVRYHFSRDEQRNIEAVQWKEAWDEAEARAPSKKLSRVQTFRGSWNFTSTCSNCSKAVNTVQFDPKGMPMWLARPMVNKFLRKGLEDIRSMTSEPTAYLSH